MQWRNNVKTNNTATKKEDAMTGTIATNILKAWEATTAPCRYFDVLGISHRSVHEGPHVIRALAKTAYRRLTLLLHPDKHRDEEDTLKDDTIGVKRLYSDAFVCVVDAFHGLKCDEDIRIAQDAFYRQHQNSMYTSSCTTAAVAAAATTTKFNPSAAQMEHHSNVYSSIFSPVNVLSCNRQRRHCPTLCIGTGGSSTRPAFMQCKKGGRVAVDFMRASSRQHSCQQTPPLKRTRCNGGQEKLPTTCQFVSS